MKKELLFISAISSIALMSLSSCRSNDTDQVLQTGGIASVKVNLSGTDYAGLKGAAQASLKTEVNSDVQSPQRQLKLVTPSSYIEAELSSVNTTVNSSQASLKSNLLAAATGDPLGAGMKFRVIAYKNNGDYQTHQDYTVGEAATPMMLDNGVAYHIVTYSYGTSSLPVISSGEQTNISSATVNYDDDNRDFMHQNIPFTPTSSSETLNITLRHKLSQITTIVNSVGLGDITNITGGVLTPHYSNGVVSLSTGVMSGRSSTTSGAVLNFPSSGFPGITQSSSPVFVNADSDGNATGGFSADITVNGTPKTISLPNAFKITPENKSNLTINLRKCGAYIGPNTDPANYKEFMCQNLGATSGNPFSAEAGNHGAKYQWGAQTDEAGRYYSQEDDQINSGAISGWITTGKPNGSWSDTSKTAYDPCPSGYRVPTSAQWQAVIDNNTVERVGIWTDSPSNYTTALYFRNPSNQRTLMLPAAGYRYHTNGTLIYRGFGGGYWSSSVATSNAYNLGFISSTVIVGYNDPIHGFSVRCVAE